MEIQIYTRYNQFGFQMVDKKRKEKKFPILLVEDEPVTAKRIESTLSKAKYPVSVAQNGREALQQISKKFYPFIITDWMMPEIDGLELCRRIKDSQGHGYCYIVILTSRDCEEDIVSAIEAGADDFLTKSPSHGELLARVKAGMRILQLEQSLVEVREELKKLSVTDSLTGCYNRSYLDEHLPHELERAKRYRRPLSLLFCDLDHFKHVNDTFGHQAGDSVLKEFVGCIEHSIRNGLDWLARYGGEEFLIIAPETDLEGARGMAERIRKEVSEIGIQLPSQTVRITASFGVTGISPRTAHEKISPTALIDLADEQLYNAKIAGRNRVCMKGM